MVVSHRELVLLALASIPCLTYGHALGAALTYGHVVPHRATAPLAVDGLMADGVTFLLKPDSDLGRARRAIRIPSSVEPPRAASYRDMHW